MPFVKGVVFCQAKEAAGKRVFRGANHKVVDADHLSQPLEHEHVDVRVDAAEAEHQQRPQHVAGVLRRVRVVGGDALEADAAHRRRRVHRGQQHVGAAPQQRRQRRVPLRSHLARRQSENDHRGHLGVEAAGRLDGAHLPRVHLSSTRGHQEEYFL